MVGEILIGISPGTRVMGLAVMHKGALLEWRVKTFKSKWSTAKQRNILNALERICVAYSVSVIAIKKLDPIRSSKQLDMLLRQFVQQSELQGRQVYRYSLADLDYEASTRKSLSEQVSAKHPELKQKYLRERENSSEYYTKMFEAIAIAEQCKDGAV